MTRENKLALVVGFALILFVGILVSDHFSIAQTQQAADLVPARREIQDPSLQDPDLMVFAAPPSTPTPVSAAPSTLLTTAELPGDPLREEPKPLVDVGSREEIRMPDLLSGHRTVGLPPSEAQDLPFRFHDVRPGETLGAICQAYYGDRSLVVPLAKFNGLADPNHLASGRRLRIPGAAHLLGRPAPATAGGPAPAPRQGSGDRTYRVKPGDVLSMIAQREMGSARHTQALFRHNRDVIDNPDRLEAGVLLKIPASAGG